MNQRITELAVAAAPANSSIPHSEWNIPKEFIEKFAELIVREVFIKIEDERYEVYEPVKEAVMKHFGVEE